MELKNNIKKYRESKGMTQEELSRKIEVSNKQVYNIEKGSNTTIIIAKKIAKVLNTTLNDLYPSD